MNGVTVFGDDYDTLDGTCTRDYIHLSGLAATHVVVLGELKAGGASRVLNCSYGRGFSERELLDAVQAAPPADFSDLQPDQIEAHLKWYAKVEGYRADAMSALTERFDELLREDGKVPHTVRTELRGRLEELRTWRNALCHGAWFGCSGAGAVVLSHYYRERKRTVRFPPMVTRKDLVDLRASIVDATIRVVEASAVAGSGSALAVVLARKFEPRNREPEQE